MGWQRILSVVHTAHNTPRWVILVRWRAHKSQRHDQISTEHYFVEWMQYDMYVSYDICNILVTFES